MPSSKPLPDIALGVRRRRTGTVVCSMCKRDVPSTRASRLMGRLLCQDCAAAIFPDEDAVEET